MNGNIIVALISLTISTTVSLYAIYRSARNTREEMVHKLDTNQQITNVEINHIKEDIKEIKEDVKAHNQYAKLFNENIPVIKEQIKVVNHRIKDLEKGGNHNEN